MSATSFRSPAPAHARHLGASSLRATPPKRSFDCTTFVLASPDAIWYALTDPHATARYWNHANVSTWQPGARWDHVRTDGSGLADAGGVVVDAERPHHLAFTFGPSRETAYDGASRVRLTLTPTRRITRIDLRHDGLLDEREVERAGTAWSAVLAGLKTFLEVGRPLPSELWAIASSRVRG